MYLNVVSFDFQSADLAAEEHNYFAHHVPLARRFGGLRFYYTGRIVHGAGAEPGRLRTAILGYDSAEAAADAMRSEVIAPLVADTRAHLTNLASISISGEAIVPCAPREPGAPCFIMAAEFDLEGAAGDLAAAERHYRGVHVELARKLPGLRHYLIGKIERGASASDRYRMAVLVFDSLEAFRAAYKSPAGQVLVRDENATIRNARVMRIDARSEV
ncbi:MAG TPA: EthD family reductase [Candidatus Binataceae bacterium]|nr:EthD family reductase [Candidatus Binataceae bacterium]